MTDFECVYTVDSTINVSDMPFAIHSSLHKLRRNNTQYVFNYTNNIVEEEEEEEEYINSDNNYPEDEDDDYGYDYTRFDSIEDDECDNYNRYSCDDDEDDRVCLSQVNPNMYDFNHEDHNRFFG